MQAETEIASSKNAPASVRMRAVWHGRSIAGQVGRTLAHVKRPSRQATVGGVTALAVIVGLVVWGSRKESHERQLVAEQKAHAAEQARLRAEAEEKAKEVQRLRREVLRLQKLQRERVHGQKADWAGWRNDTREPSGRSVRPTPLDDSEKK